METRLRIDRSKGGDRFKIFAGDMLAGTAEWRTGSQGGRWTSKLAGYGDETWMRRHSTQSEAIGRVVVAILQNHGM